MPIHFFPDDHSLTLIELAHRQLAPEGSFWVNVEPCLGGCWYLDGNLPEPHALMRVTGEYRGRYEAIEAALAHAHKAGVDELWIEFDARRC